MCRPVESVERNDPDAYHRVIRVVVKVVEAELECV